jgi:cardiolipin synthase
MLELALSAAVFISAVFASAHAVIYKREPRAAALWVIVIWLVPAAGPLFYLLFDSEGAGKHFNRRVRTSQEPWGGGLSLEQVDRRNLPTKLRDGIARLFTSHL